MNDLLPRDQECSRHEVEINLHWWAANPELGVQTLKRFKKRHKNFDVDYSRKAYITLIWDKEKHGED